MSKASCRSPKSTSGCVRRRKVKNEIAGPERIDGRSARPAAQEKATFARGNHPGLPRQNRHAQPKTERLSRIGVGGCPGRSEENREKNSPGEKSRPPSWGFPI